MDANLLHYLLKSSFNSCSEEKGPRLATKRVEHAAALAAAAPLAAAAAACWSADCGGGIEEVVLPTGLPKPGDPAAAAICPITCVNAAPPLAIVKGGCIWNKQNIMYSFYISVTCSDEADEDSDDSEDSDSSNII